MRRLPLRERRSELLGANGLEAWAQVVERGYEGLVAKDPASPYVGGRTLKWLKVKQRDYRVEERGCDPRKS
jgi:ATP-dependent DNA ligase